MYIILKSDFLLCCHILESYTWQISSANWISCNLNSKRATTNRIIQSNIDSINNNKVFNDLSNSLKFIDNLKSIAYNDN